MEPPLSAARVLIVTQTPNPAAIAALMTATVSSSHGRKNEVMIWTTLEMKPSHGAGSPVSSLLG
jgi:hypothetical protein